MSGRRYVTTAIAAEMLGVSQQHVLNLIRAGKLVANNIAGADAKRPTYRVLRESIVQFQEAPNGPSPDDSAENNPNNST